MLSAIRSRRFVADYPVPNSVGTLGTKRNGAGGGPTPSAARARERQCRMPWSQRVGRSLASRDREGEAASRRIRPTSRAMSFGSNWITTIGARPITWCGASSAYQRPHMPRRDGGEASLRQRRSHLPVFHRGLRRELAAGGVPLRLDGEETITRKERRPDLDPASV